MKSQLLKLSILVGMTGFVVACGRQVSQSSDTNEIEKISIGIQGYEFGPAVNKVILNLKENASSLDTSAAKVTTAGVERNIVSSYLSDANGKAIKNGQSSDYVTIELQVNYNFEDPSKNASPFNYNLSSMMNEWTKDYQVSIENVMIDGQQRLSKKEDTINNRVSKEVSEFNKRDSYSGIYTNPLTSNKEELTLNYAAYEPKNLKNGEKNPLIVWLHGQGEGGTDPDISLLGNEVTALSSQEIQSYFTSGSGKETGAYLLAVQTPTYWMDEGDGTNGAGAGVSRYTEILMDTIKSYVKSNPDIDTSRIYLAGCSNGGYMTINLALHNPDYFAALVPEAAAYSYYSFERNEDGSYKKTTDQTTGSEGFVKDGGIYFDEEKVKILSKIPMWFIHSANDQIVKPEDYALPIYKALVKNGADNKWFSYYESVIGTDIKDYNYMGHWSWIYFFNNQVEGVQDIEKIKNSSELTGFEPSNVSKGGTAVATKNSKTYRNVFEWLNEQQR